MQRIGLVIGGASGIGAAVTEKLAAAGLRIVVADLDGQAASRVAVELDGTGHIGRAADIFDEADIVALFDVCERDIGPVAVLVVAAGVSGFVDGKRPSLRDTSVEEWDRTMAVNARGTFLCVREMLRRRATHPVEHGRIILLSSMAAQASAKNGPGTYVASKGAVLSLVRPAANEAAEFQVTVNAVAPGPIDTPMLRDVMPSDQDDAYFGASVARRVGSAAEVAAAIAFLASEQSQYINGACIDVNGGLHMR